MLLFVIFRFSDSAELLLTLPSFLILSSKALWPLQIEAEASSCWVSLPPIVIVYCWLISVLTTLTSVWLYLWHCSSPGNSEPASFWEALSWIPAVASTSIVLHCIWVVVFGTEFHFFASGREQERVSICWVSRRIGSKLGIPLAGAFQGARSCSLKD